MATTATPAEQQFVFYDVDWEFYQSVLEKLEDRPVFVTYDRGSLEVMSPSRKHETAGGLLGRMLVTFTEELNIPIGSGGSTTFRREDLDRGLEPDECFWIQNEARVRGKDDIDLSIDPPPDISIEIEISTRLLDREGIYAALGVPELWRSDGEQVRVSVLELDGRYHPQEHSLALPSFPLAEAGRILQLRKTTDETTLIRAFREWVRAHLPAR